MFTGHLEPGDPTPSGAGSSRRVGDRTGQPGRASGQTEPPAAFGRRVETETCRSGSDDGGDPGERTFRRGDRVGGRPPATEQWWEPTDPGPPQLASVRAVPLAPGPTARATGPEWIGDRRVRCRETGVVSDTRHRPPRLSGETGDVNRSSRRLTPDVRPMVDLSTRDAPEGAPGLTAGSTDRGAQLFRPPIPKNARFVARAATNGAFFGSCGDGCQATCSHQWA